MTADRQGQVALARMRRVIAWVLGSMAALAVVSVAAGLWPTALVDDCAVRWFGGASLRARLVGVFCVYGLIVLAVLLPARVVQALVQRLHR